MNANIFAVAQVPCRESLLISSVPNLRTTSWNTLNCSTAIEDAPACNTNNALMSPCSTLKYNTSKAITLGYNLTNQRAHSCRASTRAARVQMRPPFYK
jgi:hypothetical protein